jgi:hypothetical protein
MWVFLCEAFSLTRGRVCSLLLLVVLASAVILGPQSRVSNCHVLLSHIRDSPNLEGQVQQEHGGSVNAQAPSLEYSLNDVTNYTKKTIVLSCCGVVE